MRSHLLITLLLLWLATPLAAAQAMLTLGAAPGVTPGLQSAEQARQLAAALGKALGEEIELRLFTERFELDQAMLKLDLAIYNATFLAEYPGQYLVIGAADSDGRLLVISRQGGVGNLPQRVAAALKHPLMDSNATASTLPPQQVAAKSYVVESPPVTPPPPLVFPELPAGLEIPVTPMIETAPPPMKSRRKVATPAVPAIATQPPSQAVTPPVATVTPSKSVAATTSPPPPAKAEPVAALPIPVAVETVAVTRPEPVGIEPSSATTPPVAPREPVIEGEVPPIIAQPAIPQELRPPGVPLPRPGRLPSAPPPKDEVPALLSKLPEKIGRTQKPAPLLPEPDPEPGIVYVVPFITLMVPDAVKERVFDQFVDTLNQTGANRKLRFVILKESLDKIDRDWLNARKYVFGEIYGYVEDSSCCSTDLRAKTRLTYYRAHHPEPTLRYEYPIRTFFEHDRSNIETERHKLADQIASALVAELTKALQP